MSGSVLYYIRHGQTDWNAEKRFQGRQDISLNNTGRLQAEQNGEKLLAYEADFSSFRFFASPLERTCETMRIIRRKLGLAENNFEITEELIEASYGDFEGQRLVELEAQNPEMMKARDADRWNFCPPNGESSDMVRARIRPWLEALEENSIIVAHGALGRAVRQILLSLDEDEAGNFTFPQDRVFRFQNGIETLI